MSAPLSSRTLLGGRARVARGLERFLDLLARGEPHLDDHVGQEARRGAALGGPRDARQPLASAGCAVGGRRRRPAPRRRSRRRARCRRSSASASRSMSSSPARLTATASPALLAVELEDRVQVGGRSAFGCGELAHRAPPPVARAVSGRPRRARRGEHELARGGPAGPHLEAERALCDEHLEPVDRARAVCSAAASSGVEPER